GEGLVDVGAVLVAAGREVALHESNRVLRERTAVLAGARPVGIGDLADDFAALLDGVEDGADVEVLAERALDADLDVVEVDENGDVQTILVGQNGSLLSICESDCINARDRQRPAVAGQRSQRSSLTASGGGVQVILHHGRWLMANGCWRAKSRAAGSKCDTEER